MSDPALEPSCSSPVEQDHTMSRYRSRSRWLRILIAASILAVCAFWLARRAVSFDPVREGSAAYARGQWQVAAELRKAAFESGWQRRGRTSAARKCISSPGK